jgi:hypothetical protein
MAAAGRRQRPDVLPAQTAISWRDTHRLIPSRGAWYAARSLRTALAESIYHRTRELAEGGGFDTQSA